MLKLIASMYMIYIVIYLPLAIRAYLVLKLYKVVQVPILCLKFLW